MEDNVLCYECPKYHARYDFPQIFHYDDQCLGIPCLWTPNDPHVNGHYWKTNNVTKPMSKSPKEIKDTTYMPLSSYDNLFSWISSRGCADRLDPTFEELHEANWIRIKYRYPPGRRPVFQPEAHIHTAFHGTQFYNFAGVMHAGKIRETECINNEAVSYTHLTLPTSDLV